MALPPRDDAAVARAVAALDARFGDRCQTGAAIRDQHGHTATWMPTQAPDAVVWPVTTEEVQALVRICAAERVPVIGFGAGTSLEGHVNAPAGGVSVDFTRMDKVLAVHADDMDCTVQPGVARKALNVHLRDTGLFFPVDPGADASLGGMAATRASGTNAVRYGTMRDAVLGLKAVLPSGEVVTTAHRARKSSAGYDLTRLMVGSEGTLGLITELTLRLHGIPEAISAATCSFPDVEAACNAVIAVLQYGVPVARMEMLDTLTVKAVNAYSGLDLPLTPLLLLEFHGSPAGVAEQAQTVGEIAAEFGAAGFDWTADAEARTKLWQARHDAYWACHGLRPGLKSMSTDVCVPVSHLATCVGAVQARAAAEGLAAPVLGHVGDGNFHVLLQVDTGDAAEVARAEAFVGWLNDLAIAHDGTCTGEHGIGQGKAKYLPRELGPEAIGMMRAIKRGIDPHNIMNPGKIFDMGNAGPT
ncbi:FAD-binding oxidoreductase [Meridianimarinicoccus roseus]|uniref:D-lactate dehydrogenase (cytochrome) n=1 Tax=Meridianimarinicoccus roseus TaxID=2072018 RepID=A0A2V2LQA5_9RHOB|nr:FAD-linked oxidase C-terminal domain-containing protein [Meridianimarinicoccus roseus]PWR04389.1 FAD-binding oxidoreductase [Meridianimarinicoccus roseus]